MDKVEAATARAPGLEVPDPPTYEDESLVTEGRGVGSSYLLLAAYDRLLEVLNRVLHYHFELLSLGYGAYLAFYELCRKAFPDIADKTIAKMVTGIDLVALRPDDELRRLARLAVELGVAAQVRGADGEKALRTALAGTRAGSSSPSIASAESHPTALPRATARFRRSFTTPVRSIGDPSRSACNSSSLLRQRTRRSA